LLIYSFFAIIKHKIDKEGIMAVECPVCKHDDQVVKVSSIYSSGFSMTSQGGPVVGVGFAGGKLGVGIGGGSTSGVNVSQMSMRLKPPEKPNKLGWFIIFIICGFISFLIALIFARSNSGFGYIMTFLLPIGIFIFWINSRDRKYKDRMEIYESLVNQWNQLYFCSRDDIVFLPGEEFRRSPEELQSYFNSQLS
jgi:hypothetical protein